MYGKLQKWQNKKSHWQKYPLGKTGWLEVKRQKRKIKYCQVSNSLEVVYLRSFSGWFYGQGRTEGLGPD